MIAVRVVTAADVQTLANAFPERGATPVNRHVEQFARQELGQVTCLAAWDDATPIGYVFLRWPGSSDATPPSRSLGCVEIGDLFVAEHARRRGVGTMLLDALDALAAERGHDLVGLEVTESNPFNDVARGLYFRRGYRDAGFGTFVSGYTYWDAAGNPQRDEESYRYLIKRIC